MASTLLKLACLALLATAAPHKTLAQDAPPQAPPPAQAAVSSQEAAAAPGTRRVSIVDPEMNMEAFSIEIPSDWVFDGTIVPTPACSSSQSMAIRMESPDGFSAARVLPAITWMYSDGEAKTPIFEQCRMFGGEKSAGELLKLAIHLLNVEYVSDTSTDLDQVKSKWATLNTDKVHWSVDKARAIVKFKMNSTPMDGRVSVLVLCEHTTAAKFTTCSATISRSWAPAGQYDDAKFEAVQHTLVSNKDYLAAREARFVRELEDDRKQKAITDPVQRRHDPKRTARYEASLVFTRQRDDLFPNAAPYHDAGDIGTHPLSMRARDPQPDRVVDD